MNETVSTQLGQNTQADQSTQAPPSMGARISVERWMVIIGIVVCAVLGWTVLVFMARGHAISVEGYAGLGPGMEMLGWILKLAGLDQLPTGVWGDICRAFVISSEPQSAAWLWQEAVLAFMMWMVMSFAMMLPTAAPFISTYGDIAFAARQKDIKQPGAIVFVAGYLMVWGAAAIVATGVQWSLGGIANAGNDIPVLINSAPIVGGILLISAGAYQWSPIKEACLSQCRSPMRFFMTYWREGTLGATVMGIRHGLYCVGCCWAIMALMFVGGSMNLIWMAVLTVVMLLERILPQGKRFGQFTGVIFVLWGLLLLSFGI